MSVAAEPIPAIPPATDGRAAPLRRLGGALAGVAVAEALGLVLLGAIGDPRFSLGPDLISVGFIATVVAYPLMGALIIRRRLASIELGPRIGGAPHDQRNLEELQRMATLVVKATRLGTHEGRSGRGEAAHTPARRRAKWSVVVRSVDSGSGAPCSAPC